MDFEDLDDISIDVDEIGHSNGEECVDNTSLSLYDPEGSLRKVEALIEQDRRVEHSEIVTELDDITYENNLGQDTSAFLSPLSFQNVGNVPVISDNAQINLNLNSSANGPENGQVAPNIHIHIHGSGDNSSSQTNKILDTIKQSLRTTTNSETTSYIKVVEETTDLPDSDSALTKMVTMNQKGHGLVNTQPLKISKNPFVKGWDLLWSSYSFITTLVILRFWLSIDGRQDTQLLIICSILILTSALYFGIKYLQYNNRQSRNSLLYALTVFLLLNNWIFALALIFVMCILYLLLDTALIQKLQVGIKNQRQM